MAAVDAERGLADTEAPVVALERGLADTAAAAAAATAATCSTGRSRCWGGNRSRTTCLRQ